jgi:hypothetical protein
VLGFQICREETILLRARFRFYVVGLATLSPVGIRICRSGLKCNRHLQHPVTNIAYSHDCYSLLPTTVMFIGGRLRIHRLKCSSNDEERLLLQLNSLRSSDKYLYTLSSCSEGSWVQMSVRRPTALTKIFRSFIKSLHINTAIVL